MKAGDNMVTVFTGFIAVYVVKAICHGEYGIWQIQRRGWGCLFRLVNWTPCAMLVPVIRGIAGASHLSLFAAGAVLIVRGQIQIGDPYFWRRCGRSWGGCRRSTRSASCIKRRLSRRGGFMKCWMPPPPWPMQPARRNCRVGRGPLIFSSSHLGMTPASPSLKISPLMFPADRSSQSSVPPGPANRRSCSSWRGSTIPNPAASALMASTPRLFRCEACTWAIGFVFQETFLFSDTVANNIRYGNPDCTMADVETAAPVPERMSSSMNCRRVTTPCSASAGRRSAAGATAAGHRGDR